MNSVWPSWWELAMLAVIGGLGGLAQLCLTQAFRDADATLVYIFLFFQLSYIIFVDFHILCHFFNFLHIFWYFKYYR